MLVSQIGANVDRYIEALADHLDTSLGFALEGHLDVSVDDIDPIVLNYVNEWAENNILNLRDDFLALLRKQELDETFKDGLLAMAKRRGKRNNG